MSTNTNETRITPFLDDNKEYILENDILIVGDNPNKHILWKVKYEKTQHEFYAYKVLDENKVYAEPLAMMMQNNTGIYRNKTPGLTMPRTSPWFGL